MRRGSRVQAIQLLKASFPELKEKQLRSFVASRQVRIDGETIVDPSQSVASTGEAFLDIPRYVSRGGLKLEHALEQFSIDVSGLFCLDAGSSTGGFTDCLLQHGASAVHAVDVGYNQLDYRLRVDKRVIVHERTNILHLEATDPPSDIAVADLSFRSVRGVASHILSLTTQKKLIFLIKPQFEVDPDTEGFNGVITDDELLKKTMDEVYVVLTDEGIGIHGLLLSPITGRKGNREFLALLAFDGGMSRQIYREAVDDLLGSSRRS
ncbi:MAG: TlyA family RNA methyltransferase [Sphaerochaetaceae bacterium]|nr:TlyA family RNA methyltransferase [Sphaerochaetaceae bacterium]